MSSQKKNIAIIIPGGVGTGSNNIGVPVLERIIRLLSVDFNITVFQLFPVNDSYKPDGFELHGIYSSNPIIKIIKLFLLFRKTHRHKKFKAIHGYWILPGGFLAVLLGKLYGIKSIVSVLGGDAIALPEIGYGQLQSPVYRRFISWTINNADEANALTQYLVNNLRKVHIMRDIKVIPWGIDTTLFSYQKKPLSNPVQFLHVANLTPVKDQDTLLRTFKIIAEQIPCRLTIIGTGSLEAHVRSSIDSLKLKDRVTIISPLPYDQLPEHYHRADILLHTSLSEGQSEVVTEAMSAGVVVCGTQVGLMHDLPDCCVSVPVGNYELLAKNVLQLIGNSSQFSELQERAREWTQNHSIEWTAEKTKDLYRNA